jgi:hypothetical protein
MHRVALLAGWVVLTRPVKYSDMARSQKFSKYVSMGASAHLHTQIIAQLFRIHSNSS